MFTVLLILTIASWAEAATTAGGPVVAEPTDNCCAVKNVVGTTFENAASLAGFYYLYKEEGTVPDVSCVDGCVYKKLVDDGEKYYCFTGYTAEIVPTLECTDANTTDSQASVVFDVLTVDPIRVKELMEAAGADPTLAGATYTIAVTLQYWNAYGLAALETNVLGPVYGITTATYENFLSYYGYGGVDLTLRPRKKRDGSDVTNPGEISCTSLHGLELFAKLGGEGESMPSQEMIDELKAICKSGVSSVSKSSLKSHLPRLTLDIMHPEELCDKALRMKREVNAEMMGPEGKLIVTMMNHCERQKALQLARA